MVIEEQEATRRSPCQAIVQRLEACRFGRVRARRSQGHFGHIHLLLPIFDSLRLVVACLVTSHNTEELRKAFMAAGDESSKQLLALNLQGLALGLIYVKQPLNVARRTWVYSDHGRDC